MKKFVLLALIGLISYTEAIHLNEEPAADAAAPAGDEEPKEPKAAPAPTEEEKKEAAKKTAEEIAAQEEAELKAKKAMKKEEEALEAEEFKKKSDYEKELHAIASTNHKASNAFDDMQKSMYERDSSAT